MKGSENCPDCGTELGPIVARVSNGVRDPESPVQMCFNVHCGFINEV